MQVETTQSAAYIHTITYIYAMMQWQSSFPIIKFVESLESHYNDFSTCRKAVNICKISAKSPYQGKTWIFPIKNISKFDSVILLTLSRFSILSRVNVLGKLEWHDFRYTIEQYTIKYIVPTCNRHHLKIVVCISVFKQDLKSEVHSVRSH